MTIVKFCGIRNQIELDHAIGVGCDLVGLNFVSHSPRVVDVEAASAMVASRRDASLFVGVFMDPAESEVRRVLTEVDLDFLQFSGNETESFCELFNLPYIKSFKMLKSLDFVRESKKYPNTFAYLLDSASKMGGGSGKTFDWTQFPASSDRRVLLAGGLTPENVGDAIAQTNPWGVDVASGIECTGYRKSYKRMQRFILATRRV